jgi:uroporphyrinogen III methyltransferase/synthase
MVMVGDVVRFRDTIAWFEKKPLLGRKVVVTRNREQAGELAVRLERKGAEVLRLPLLSIVPSTDPEVEEEVFEELGSYDWIVFSSANGVRCFFDLLIEKYEDLRAFGNLRVAAVGEATARAVRAYHLRVDLIPNRATAEDLAEALIATGELEHAKVVVVTGNLGRDVLIDRLNEARAIVDRFPVYRTEKTGLTDHSGARVFREHGADAVLFTSSSAVRSFADQAEALKLGPDAKRPLAGSIGPITSETMRKVGMPVDFVAKKSTLDDLVDALCSALNKR